MSQTKSVLVVDDESLIVEVLSMMLTDVGLDVCATAASADEAIVMAKQHHPSLVVMDMRLKGLKDGVDAATAIRRQHMTPVIFITGSREPATVERINSISRRVCYSSRSALISCRKPCCRRCREPATPAAGMAPAAPFARHPERPSQLRSGCRR